MIKKAGLIIILNLCLLACGKHEKITNIDNIYIEVLSDDEMSVEKVVLEKEDVTRVIEILSQIAVESDGGAVFAEGGYRIVLETEEEQLDLYPYCGVPSIIRVGDDGCEFLWIDEGGEKELQDIFDKYAGDKDGIWSWDNVM